MLNFLNLHLLRNHPIQPQNHQNTTNLKSISYKIKEVKNISPIKKMSQHKNLTQVFWSYERIGRDIFQFSGDYKTVVAHTRRIIDRYPQLLVRSTTH